MKVKKKKKYQNGGLLGPGDDRPVEGVSMLPTAEVTAQFNPVMKTKRKFTPTLV